MNYLYLNNLVRPKVDKNVIFGALDVIHTYLNHGHNWKQRKTPWICCGVSSLENLKNLSSHPSFFLFRYTKDPKTETNNGFIEGSGKVFLRPKYNGEVNFDWSASSDPIFEKVSAQHTMDWKLALSFIMMSSSFSIDPYFCINSKQIKFFNSQFYLKVLSNSKRALVFFVSPLLR